MSKKNETRDAAKDFQRSKGEEPDSSKQFSAAEHQARNDAQKSGENVGDRDLSSKKDVPSKEEKQESAEPSEAKSEKK
jgi:hypothetical protein